MRSDPVPLGFPRGVPLMARRRKHEYEATLYGRLSPRGRRHIFMLLRSALVRVRLLPPFSILVRIVGIEVPQIAVDFSAFLRDNRTNVLSSPRSYAQEAPAIRPRGLRFLADDG